MAPRATLPLLALLVLLPGGEAEGETCNVTQLATQLDVMLAMYDRQTAPATPVSVQVALEARHATICESSGSVRLLADLYVSWEDGRLAWNASEGEAECRRALVAVDRLWRPDVGVLSAASSRAGSWESGSDVRALLSSAGRVTWVSRLDLEAPATLDLTAWPHDRHKLVFKFGSRVHFEDEIELTLKDAGEVTMFESGFWELVSVEASETEWMRAGGKMRVAQFAVTLQRRAPAHALAADAVLAGSALLLLAAAALPPTARPTLCAAASFTAALWLASAVPRLGGTSGAPRVLCALGVLCACGGVAAAMAALALRLARCTSSAPPALRQLRAYTGKFVRMFTLLEARGGEESGAWVAAAQLLDALCVLVLLLTVMLAALFGIALG